MHEKLILLVMLVMVCVGPGVHGSSHLMFSNNTQTNITRDGCGENKLCVEDPSDCDPAGNSSCLFVSIAASSPNAPNGTDLDIGLRGDSDGYIALGLTVNVSEGFTMVFVCAKNSSNNDSFFFRTTESNNSRNDNILTPTERQVKEIRGSVNGSTIRCEFTVPGVNASATGTRANPSTTFFVLLGNGSINAGDLEAFNSTRSFGQLDLSNPASNSNATVAPTTPNTTTPNTTTPNTTTPTPTTPTPTSTTASSAISTAASGTLVLMSVLIFSTMQRA